MVIELGSTPPVKPIDGFAVVEVVVAALPVGVGPTALAGEISIRRRFPAATRPVAAIISTSTLTTSSGSRGRRPHVGAYARDVQRWNVLGRELDARP
jgi:Tfp pilus assembly protein PilV